MSSTQYLCLRICFLKSHRWYIWPSPNQFPQMPFLPRTSFPFSPNTPSWFAGHMARSLRELPPLLENINLVIEARDARLPLTSINPIFDGVLRRWKARAKVEGERERIVVYTKRDLAETRFEGVSYPSQTGTTSFTDILYSMLKPLTRAFVQNGSQKIMFADTRKNSDVSHILRYAVGEFLDSPNHAIVL